MCMDCHNGPVTGTTFEQKDEQRMCDLDIKMMVTLNLPSNFAQLQYFTIPHWKRDVNVLHGHPSCMWYLIAFNLAYSSMKERNMQLKVLGFFLFCFFAGCFKTMAQLV